MSSDPFNAPNNVFPIEPTLADVLNLLKKDIMLTLNCHAIGAIQSFNAAKQTAVVTINYTKTFVVNGPQGPETQLRSYPAASDCPVIFLGGGSSYLTFPVAQGDECLLLFNDRDMDNWFTNHGTQPNSNRLHSFSDAVALVGLRSSSKAIASFDLSRVLLKKGNAKVGVGKNDELVLVGNETYTLNQLLQELISEIQSLTVLCAGSGSPSGPPLNAGALGATASKISQLLE